jgi:hypothetical protein
VQTHECNIYRPLPQQLVIKDSGIDGLGLFVSEYIAVRTYACQMHIGLDEN